MRRAGFTLIEMMTVVAIFGLVAVYVGRILTVNERAYHTVENTSESQQNLRVFGAMLEDDLRHAGMMVSRNAAVCGIDSTTGPDTLYVSDAAAIDPQDDFNVYAGATVTGGVNNLSLGTQTLTPANAVAPWLLFRPDGIPVRFEGALGACGAIGTTALGGAGFYLTNGTRDYAVVLSPMGGVRVWVWDTKTGAWKS